jgi:SOS-response transcriptional repressor LexA
MPGVDWGLLINWIVSGVIGLICGIGGGYVTYRLDRRRDDLQWQRERLKLEEQWKHEREQREAIWRLKLRELEMQYEQEQRENLRRELTKGLDDPSHAVRAALEGDSIRQSPTYSAVRTGGIPIVGTVQAGLDRLADQDVLGFLSLGVKLARSVTHAVEVEGRSMIDYGIYPGDFVLVHEQTHLERGEVGVFLIICHEGFSEITLKRYYPEADHCCLKPMNENEPTALVIGDPEQSSRIKARYEQDGVTVQLYTHCELRVVARAQGLVRFFDRSLLAE